MLGGSDAIVRYEKDGADEKKSRGESLSLKSGGKKVFLLLTFGKQEILPTPELINKSVKKPNFSDKL